MAEGIMGLAPGMGAPTAPQTPSAAPDPRAMDTFFNAMDPEQIDGQVDEALSEIDPALMQEIQADLAGIQLPPEIIQALLNAIDMLLQSPQDYQQARMEMIQAGVPEELFPEEFNLEYLSTLRYVLSRLPMQQPEAPVQGFRNGGAVSLKPVAKFLQSQGRNGDTVLAHINRSEAAMLKRMGGSGTINPVTGLREYGVFSSIGKALSKPFKAIAKVAKKIIAPVIKVTKKLLSNPIVRVAATVAAVAFSGGTASALLGAGSGSTVAGMSLGATINSTAVSLLAGETPKDALKQGLMTGATVGIGSYAAGMPLTQSTADIGLTNPFTGTTTGVRDMIGKGVDAINPFSSGTPKVTADTKFDELVAKGLPRDANTYKLAQEAANSSGSILGLSKDNAVLLASTLGPPLLAQLGQEEPPTPEDLNMPGVGGETGIDLYNKYPGEYGIDLGGTESIYADLANTPAMEIGGGSGDTGETTMPGEAPPPPVTAMPGQVAPPPSAGAGDLLSGDLYSDLFKDYGGSSSAGSSTASASDPFYNPASDPSNPDYNPALDPNSPLYNPFLVQTASAPVSQPVSNFAKGGIATIPVQKFAQGGTSFTRTQSSGGRSYMLPTPPKSSSSSAGPKLTADQKLQVQANAFKTSQAAKSAKDRSRAAQDLSASNAVYERMALENLAKQQKARQEAEAAAQLKAKTDQAVEMAARAMARGEIYTPDLNRAYLYGTPQEQMAAIELARIQNPERFMSPVERENQRLQQEYQKMLRDREEFERVEADKIKVAQADAAAAAENARLQKQIDDFKKYQESILNPPSTVTAPTAPTSPGTGTGGIGTLPVTPPQDIVIGGTAPVTTPPITIPVTEAPISPTVPEAPGISAPTAPITEPNTPITGIPDIAPTAPTAPVEDPFAISPAVYGPDGTEYPSAQAAITMGVFNYSPYPPQNIPTVGIPNIQPATATSFDPTSNPFAPGAAQGNFFTSDFSGTPAVGFAQGGIAAMAPYRFKSGSNPARHFPRRTGPINGPGTGTSDSIPAMLSDGEFVFTAKAVRGMGNGSRLQGAKKMYKMMKMLEGKG